MISMKRGRLVIEMDSELLEGYKEYCKENGLNPKAHIVLYIQTLVGARLNIQKMLWDAVAKAY
ncbi:MAG: hypothetical protein AB1779_03955 [Candidatus Thermoplasmatota archaeon]